MAGSSRILIVDDDSTTIHLLTRILATLGQVRFARGGLEAFAIAREWLPDLILLDAQMPGLSGFEVCRQLKADDVLRGVPVMIVTAHADAAHEVAGFTAGASDFIAKPVDARLVLARARAQLRFKAMADELRRVSVFDDLTGVGNRRSFDAALGREWRRALRGSEPIALLLVDIDHFKQFNDHLGHQAGDVCLRAVAGAVASASASTDDLVARFGGEEFAVVLPQSPRSRAAGLAQRVLDGVDALQIAHPASPTGPHVTISVGVGCYDADCPAWSEPGVGRRLADQPPAPPHCTEADLVAAADRALYAAKGSGRAHGRLWGIGEDPAALAPRPIGGIARRPQ